MNPQGPVLVEKQHLSDTEALEAPGPNSFVKSLLSKKVQQVLYSKISSNILPSSAACVVWIH